MHMQINIKETNKQMWLHFKCDFTFWGMPYFLARHQIDIVLTYNYYHLDIFIYGSYILSMFVKCFLIEILSKYQISREDYS